MGIAAVVAAARSAGHADGSPLEVHGGWRIALSCGLVAAFAAYCVACARVRGQGRATVRAVALVAAAVQLVPLAAPLLLSTDALSYTTYGRADDPYSDHPEWATPSVYGPLWTLLSEIGRAHV